MIHEPVLHGMRHCTGVAIPASPSHPVTLPQQVQMAAQQAFLAPDTKHAHAIESVLFSVQGGVCRRPNLPHLPALACEPVLASADVGDMPSLVSILGGLIALIGMDVCRLQMVCPCAAGSFVRA
jgi:hypothetical protein